MLVGPGCESVTKRKVANCLNNYPQIWICLFKLTICCHRIFLHVLCVQREKVIVWRMWVNHHFWNIHPWNLCFAQKETEALLPLSFHFFVLRRLSKRVILDEWITMGTYITGLFAQKESPRTKHLESESKVFPSSYTILCPQKFTALLETWADSQRPRQSMGP